MSSIPTRVLSPTSLASLSTQACALYTANGKAGVQTQVNERTATAERGAYLVAERVLNLAGSVGGDGGNVEEEQTRVKSEGEEDIAAGAVGRRGRMGD